MKSANLGVVLVLATLVVSSSNRDSLRAGVETGTVSGRVVASHDNKPIPYANVMLVGTTMGAMSLPDGSYEIKGVPVGTYTVKAMMMGYEVVEKNDVVVSADDTTFVTFELKVKAIAKIQDVVVTGEKAMVEVSHTTGGVSEQQLQSMPVDDVLESVGLKAGIVSGGMDAQYGGAPACRPPDDAWRYRGMSDRETYEA